MLPYKGGYRMNIMTKKGSLDNIVTYEHFCDNKSDLANIPKNQITLGSTAIVLQDEDNGMGIYIANSNKEWIAVSISNGDRSYENISLDFIHICASGEYDSQSLIPTILDPEENVFYLVPNNGSNNDLFDEWIYTNGQWEKFGIGKIDIQNELNMAIENKAVIYNEAQTLTDTQQETARGNIGAASEGDVDELKSAFDDITEITTEEITTPVQYTTSVGFCTKDGRIFSGGSYNDYKYTEIFQVNPGDVISFAFLNPTVNMRVITAYTDEDAISDSGKENTKDPYVVPAGINGLRCTFYGAAVTGISKTFTQTTLNVKGLPEITERVEVLEGKIGNRHITGGMVYEFDINSDNHELNDTNTLVEDMFGYSIQFDGLVTTFNGLTLGHGNGIPMGGYVKVTPTNFEYYLGTEANPRLSEPHNLTIADYISVRIDAKAGRSADFTIYTNGGVYTKANRTWDVRRGRLFVNSNGTNVLTECTFAYMCRGWAEKVHLYGDSYFGTYDDKWTNYLTANNWNKCNVNAYPGRASAEALRVAKNVLNHSNPEIIVWCLGMNDGDDGGVVDASWKACVDELMEICTNRDIELILATIPNVPNVDNTAKNAYVRASGHRYIDFASAVGAANSATWFSGMLSNDGVHPATQGAIALFNQAIADVPELMQ